MEILNHTGEETVDIQIKDLIKENGEASGTEVIITIIQNLVEKNNFGYWNGTTESQGIVLQWL
jgi:hypothetical protein